MAQWLAQLTVNQWVVGSNPTSSAKIIYDNMSYKLATQKFCVTTGGGSTTTPTKLVLKKDVSTFYCQLINTSTSYEDNRAVRENDVVQKYVTDKVMFYFVKNGPTDRTYYQGIIGSESDSVGILYGQTITYTNSASFTFYSSNARIGIGPFSHQSGNILYYSPLTANIYSGSISTSFNFSLGTGGSTLYFKSGTSSGTTIPRTQTTWVSVKGYRTGSAWSNGEYGISASGTATSVSLTMYTYTWSWNTVLANIEQANVTTFNGVKYYQVAILL